MAMTNTTEYLYYGIMQDKSDKVRRLKNYQGFKKFVRKNEGNTWGGSGMSAGNPVRITESAIRGAWGYEKDNRRILKEEKQAKKKR